MLETFLKTYFKNRPLFLGLIRAKELELFQRFFPSVTTLPKLTILDFGSGDGFFTQMLCNRTGIPLTKIDIDQKITSKTIRERTDDRLVIYDGAILPFKSDSFDLVISNSVLEHVENVSQSIQELSRVLKKKGTFLCSIMTDRWEAYLIGRLCLGKMYTAWMRRIQDHKNLLLFDEWQNHFEKAGLNTKRVIGYMDKKASRWFELLHYLSFYSLILYKICGKWVVFPLVFDLFPLHQIVAPLVKQDIPVSDASALFFVLKNDA